MFPVIDHAGTRRLAAAWMALATGALGASALFALLLVLSRTPGVGELFPGHDFFYPALVLHVNLSALIWFLSFAGAFWSAALAPRALGAGWLAFALCASGSALMVVSPFGEGGGALVNNYIPVLDNAVFRAGLALFGAGALVAALRALRAGRVPEGGALRAGLTAAAVAVLVAALSLVWSAAALPEFLPPAARFEALFWGPGHTLQFAHTLLMMSAWVALAGRVPGTRLPGDRSLAALFLVSLLPVAAVPVIHFLHAPAGPDFRHGFTLLMSWGTWIGAAPLALLLAWRLLRARGLDPAARALRLALLLSFLLFLCGLALGSQIRHDNAMVPAHYHGVIGAVTLAFMALAFRMLEALGCVAPGARAARWQAALYGGGTLAMAAGLAWSGGHGVARKATGAQQLLDGLPEVAGMAVMGAGGMVAVAGGVMFVAMIFRALARGTASVSPGGARLDRRPFALAFVLGAILVIGSLVSLLPGEGSGRSVLVERPPADPRRDPTGHAREQRRAEVQARFNQAVVMLHAKQYEHAAAALHRVLELDPAIPEAHVNMGFAMIGLGRPAAARDFFLSAIELQPMQANAYYGLAEALEGLGDIPGALGAMRTYLHLAPPDDTFRRKAEAAIWEWQELPRAPGGSARAPMP
ncbi:MAG TPA: cbb3-type cytochrome c oxidase subunit I [Burkholderiales bacterium]|nr:cbb3-type cytochrome c oxidase subunit I [Burkholderiales bacterium]